MARLLRLDDIEPIHVAGVNWRPVRRPLGVSAFGVNAYSADAGEHLIEEHTEEGGGGAGGHEEMYVVIRGRARFTTGGEEHDAPAGTIVFLHDPAEKRSAVAEEDGTLALAVGGPPGAAGPVSAWEYFFAAAPAMDAGDFDRAYEIASAGLAEQDGNGALHFNLACFKARAGDRDTALEHLRRALELEPKARRWALKDDDLASLRDDPEFPVGPDA